MFTRLFTGTSPGRFHIIGTSPGCSLKPHQRDFQLTGTSPNGFSIFLHRILPVFQAFRHILLQQDACGLPPDNPAPLSASKSHDCIQSARNTSPDCRVRFSIPYRLPAGYRYTICFRKECGSSFQQLPGICCGSDG